MELVAKGMPYTVNVDTSVFCALSKTRIQIAKAQKYVGRLNTIM